MTNTRVCISFICEQYEVGLLYSCMHVGVLTGFTNLGEINSHLAAYESQVSGSRAETEVLAHSMLVIMVRGLFSKFEFPYAQFPCSDLTGITRF